jgi:hypothetical protein
LLHSFSSSGCRELPSIPTGFSPHKMMPRTLDGPWRLCLSAMQKKKKKRKKKGKTQTPKK